MRKEKDDEKVVPLYSKEHRIAGLMTLAQEEGTLNLDDEATLNDPEVIDVRPEVVPPTTQKSAPPQAQNKPSVPPPLKKSVPPQARKSAPPAARKSAPPPARQSAPPPARQAAPPPARHSAPPAARKSAAPQPRQSTSRANSGLRIPFDSAPPKPLLTPTQIRGVAELEVAEPAILKEANLRSDKTVMFEMEAERRSIPAQASRAARSSRRAALRFWDWAYERSLEGKQITKDFIAHTLVPWWDRLSPRGRWSVIGALALMAMLPLALGGSSDDELNLPITEAQPVPETVAGVTPTEQPTQPEIPVVTAAPTGVMTGVERTAPSALKMHIRPHMKSPPAADLKDGAKITVYPNFPAKDGWILGVSSKGTVGYVKKADLDK